MRKFLQSKMKGWDVMTTLAPNDYVINQHIHKLDQVASDYECRWGVGRLETLCGGALAQKWKAQKDKLHAAINDKDMDRVVDYVAATIRGYAALEKAAIASGAEMRPAHVSWDVVMPSGRTLAVCNNNDTAALLHGMKIENMVIMTMDEVGRLIDERLEGVFKPKKKMDHIQHTKIAWEAGGEAVPF